MIGLVSVTRAGHAAAERLEQAWNPDPGTRRYDGPAAEALPRAFNECDAVVSFLAVGATVRLIAPLLTSKHDDPAVVCVDEALRFAVPVLGAHQGGGNELARRVAATLGAEPVVTTASDAAGGAGLDEFGADLGFTIEPGSDLAAVGTAILSGDRVTFSSDAGMAAAPAAAQRGAHGPAGTRRSRRRGDRPDNRYVPNGPWYTARRHCLSGRARARALPRRRSASSSTAPWRSWGYHPGPFGISPRRI